MSDRLEHQKSGHGHIASLRAVSQVIVHNGRRREPGIGDGEKVKKALSVHTQKLAESNSTALTVKDPYIFEFLGLKPEEVMYESNLEPALLNKIQEFLLELGHGFCFEARQKRIVIGEEYFFVDLVFYHRILKCHVLIELKTDSFKHEHLGQLNTYLNWYRKNETQEYVHAGRMIIALSLARIIIINHSAGTEE